MYSLMISILEEYSKCLRQIDMENDEFEKCWLFEYCPCRTAVCLCTQPEDDGCPIYRRFKDIFDKQGLLKSEK